jgi:hypothetical protein
MLRGPRRNHLVYRASDMMPNIGENLWRTILNPAWTTSESAP